MILDGWGVRETRRGNAVAMARTPHLDRLLAEYPHTLLQTSGPSVGLPEGVMGNSEVGHLNIGAGRVVYQDLLRIDRSIQSGEFFQNVTLSRVMELTRQNDHTLHLIGLVSDGGVHSHMRHLKALLDMCRRRGLSKVFLHAILDGRDTAPDSGRNYVADVAAHMQTIGVGRFAAICGRYYAMDRDTRWDRTEKAYRLYTQGEGIAEMEPLAAVDNAYRRGETDEFVKPIIITDAGNRPLTHIGDGDGVIFFNFRADRTRQLTRAFTQEDFKGFARSLRPKLNQFVCMTLYDEKFSLPVVFPPDHPREILGEVLQNNGLRQLRIAETEKYAHVTYFFNGGQEQPFHGEDRCLIPSPRDVPTYDHKPEMSAFAVTEEILARIASERYDFIVLNFANMDMVGHTGILEAAIRACETVDQCVRRIVDAIVAQHGAVLITADHGNAETMLDEHNRVHTAHTTNPVRLIAIHPRKKELRLAEGILGDIAPTLLSIMGIPQPPSMTGRSLVIAS
jgi:2,3-bisphosphoglycerate-independent phosphoglycerate mutase